MSEGVVSARTYDIGDQIHAYFFSEEGMISIDTYPSYAPYVIDAIVVACSIIFLEQNHILISPLYAALLGGTLFLIVSMVLVKYLIGIPKERQLQTLSFKQLREEPHSKLFQWSKISKGIIDLNSSKKDLYLELEGKKLTLTITTNKNKSIGLFKRNLGKKLEELQKKNR